MYCQGDKKNAHLQYMNATVILKFFIRKIRQEKHTSSCSGQPGVVYSFCTQNLVSFEDNFGSKGDLPFSIYFDFETTSPSDADWLNPEEKKCLLFHM